MPTRFRTRVHGHNVELRLSDLGGEEVRVNGRVVSRRPWAGLTGSGCEFELTDEKGASRHVEVRVVAPKAGLTLTRCVEVQVDGELRATLSPTAEGRTSGCCENCGYALTGLPVENGEIRCPECGRHSLADAVTQERS